MKFRLRTLNYTRSSLQSQQIYWEWIKLKKYFKVRTLTGNMIKPKITFHRLNLPTISKHITRDMEEHFISCNPSPNKIYYLASFLFCYTAAYFSMITEFDQDFRFILAVRYTRALQDFDSVSAIVKQGIRRLLVRAGINEYTELKGNAGKHNIYNGFKNLIWKRDDSKIQQQQLEIQANSLDQQIRKFDQFLIEQDNQITRSTVDKNI